MFEKTPHFHAHQICVLTAVEQWLLFSMAHYRRAIDMLVPAVAPWAQVTLYYASFFSANAILGMSGGVVQSVPGAGITTVDVVSGTSGSFELQITRKAKSPSGASGSHRAFWDFFYSAANFLKPWVPPPLNIALDPVNADIYWQTNARNNVNYDMYLAWEAAKSFQGTFKPNRLDSLGGQLQLQLAGSERLIQLALWLAGDVGIATPAYSGSGTAGANSLVRRKLASQQPPALVKQSAFGSF